MTIGWKGWGQWGANIPHPTTVDIYTMDGSEKVFDLSRAKLHIADYDFKRRSYNIGNLAAQSKYTIIMVYKWSDGSTQMCLSYGQYDV